MMRSRVLGGEHHYPVTEDIGRADSTCFTCGTSFPCEPVTDAEQAERNAVLATLEPGFGVALYLLERGGRMTTREYAAELQRQPLDRSFTYRRPGTSEASARRLLTVLRNAGLAKETGGYWAPVWRLRPTPAPTMEQA